MQIDASISYARDHVTLRRFVYCRLSACARKLISREVEQITWAIKTAHFAQIEMNARKRERN